MADLDGDDFFPEFNPHPYRGGYDIALTYGNPLPPSPSTCYHHSPTRSALDPPPPSPPTVKPAPPPAPLPQYLDIFGSWYVGARFNWRGPDPWLWAADYLFAYLPLHSPTRHESHNYGNLNYAYERCSPSLPVSVQIDPNDGWTTHSGFPEHEEVNLLPRLSYGVERNGANVPLCLVDEQSPEAVNLHDVGVYPDWQDYHSDCNGVYKKYMEQVVTDFEYSCAYGEPLLSGAVKSVSVVEEPLLSEEVIDYQIVDHNADSCEVYNERNTAILEPLESFTSFEMDHADNFVEQLFYHGKEDARSYEDPSSAELEQFVPGWSWDARSQYDFYQQHDFLQPEHELPHDNGYHGQSYWPFQDSEYEY